jgi:lipopolysaccharide export system permease protein
MQKLIFNKFYSKVIKFFLASLLIIGIIVWTIQAVNYFDFVAEDGHSIKIYFLYSVYSFPKIIVRLLPFVFFVSLFYVLIIYERKNELNLFWINGVNKVMFLNKIIIFSFALTLIQIILASYLSPSSQFKARSFLKNSDVDFFSSLLKPGKFIDIAKNMTIFIEQRNNDESFNNIFIEDNRNLSRVIYAKKGELILNKKNRKFELFNGKIVNNDKSKINIFNFDKIDLNLSNIKAKTITAPKIQEIKTAWLINCVFKNNLEFEYFNCNKRIIPEAKEELFKRIIKPIYIPLLALIACCLIIYSNQMRNFNKIRNLLFIYAFLILIFSEMSSKYIGSSDSYEYIFLLFPLVIFIINYLIFIKRSAYV